MHCNKIPLKEDSLLIQLYNTFSLKIRALLMILACVCSSGALA